MNIPLRRIRALINPRLNKPLVYNSYQYFVRQDTELLALGKLKDRNNSSPPRSLADIYARKWEVPN
jgi:hypothetical protein